MVQCTGILRGDLGFGIRATLNFPYLELLTAHCLVIEIVIFNERTHFGRNSVLLKSSGHQ